MALLPVKRDDSLGILKNRNRIEDPRTDTDTGGSFDQDYKRATTKQLRIE